MPRAMHPYGFGCAYLHEPASAQSQSQSLTHTLTLTGTGTLTHRIGTTEQTLAGTDNLELLRALRDGRDCFGSGVGSQGPLSPIGREKEGNDAHDWGCGFTLHSSRLRVAEPRPLRHADTERLWIRSRFELRQHGRLPADLLIPVDPRLRLSTQQLRSLCSWLLSVAKPGQARPSQRPKLPSATHASQLSTTTNSTPGSRNLLDHTHARHRLPSSHTPGVASLATIKGSTHRSRRIQPTHPSGCIHSYIRPHAHPAASAQIDFICGTRTTH